MKKNIIAANNRKNRRAVKRGVVMILTNVWTSNQNCDAPVDNGTQSVAAAGSAALNKDSGVITITGLTAAAGAMQIATITNSKMVAGSFVTATLMHYTGTWATDGEPCLLQADNNTVGSIIFRVVNLHAANALNGDITVAFVVHQPVV